MNANDFIAEFGDLVNDPNNTAYKKTEVLRYVSAFTERFFVRARLSNEEIFSVFNEGFLTEADFTTDAEDAQYAHATFDDHVTTNITNLWLRTGSKRSELPFLNEQRDRSISYEQDYDHNTAASVRYNIIGSRFELHGTIPTEFTIDISFERVPPRLFIGKVSSKGNDGSGNDTFQLLYADNPVFGKLERVANRYVGTRFQGIDPEKDSPLRLITAFTLNATYAEITIEGAAAEIVDDDRIATIPDFPQDYHHMIALGAATLAAGTRGSSKLHQMLKAERNEAMRQAIILLEQRTSQPRAVWPLN